MSVYSYSYIGIIITIGPCRLRIYQNETEMILSTSIRFVVNQTIYEYILLSVMFLSAFYINRGHLTYAQGQLTPIFRDENFRMACMFCRRK